MRGLVEGFLNLELFGRREEKGGMGRVMDFKSFKEVQF